MECRETDNREIILNISDSNPKLFIDLISQYYSFDIDYLEKHKDVLNWNNLSANENLFWTIELLEKFEDKWNWTILTIKEYIPWSMELIEIFKYKWNWVELGGLSDSKSLPWTIDLIEEFKEFWQWEFLSKNSSLPWSNKLIEKFEDNWHWAFLSINDSLPWSIELLEKYEKRWYWSMLSMRKNLPWSIDLILKYIDYWAWDGSASLELMDIYKGNDNNNGIYSLSGNVALPLSIELIEKFKDNWNWVILSGNKSIEFSIELIEKFEDKWNWVNLSLNDKINLNTELVERFKERWDWGLLSINGGLQWSSELIEMFEDKWDWNFITKLEKIKWTNEKFNKYQKKWAWFNESKYTISDLYLNCNPILIEKYKNFVNWNTISDKAEFTVELIEKFEDNWDWKKLSINQNLPWSIDLIEKFQNKWNWNGCFSSLSENKSLPWSIELIEKFENKWDWDCLSRNDSIPFSVELLEKFKEKWDWDSISCQGKVTSSLKLILEFANKISLINDVWRPINYYLPNNIWLITKKDIDVELINEFFENKKNEHMNNNEVKIAGRLTTENWYNISKTLNSKEAERWRAAFKLFEIRTITRYLNPIKEIINMELNNGEGFAVVNLQCSLIETLECFINGWKFEYPNFIKPDGNSFTGSRNVFLSFFHNRTPFKLSQIDGNDFFISVRCGLLHETQTKNGWKILSSGNDKSIENKIIYRNNFQKDIESIIKNYQEAIINGSDFDGIENKVLRENFIAKFNHICKVS